MRCLVDQSCDDSAESQERLVDVSCKRKNQQNKWEAQKVYSSHKVDFQALGFHKFINKSAGQMVVALRSPHPHRM